MVVLSYAGNPGHHAVPADQSLTVLTKMRTRKAMLTSAFTLPGGGLDAMTFDEVAPDEERRRRPWWLASNSPGHAVLGGALGLLQAWLFFENSGRRVLSPFFVGTWAALIAVTILGSLVSLVAFRRHPDWVNKAWAKKALGQRETRALAFGVVIGAVITVAGVTVALITKNDLAGGVAVAGLLLAAVCAGILGTNRSNRSA